VAQGINNRLDFGGDPDHDTDPGIFKGFVIYYCDSYIHSFKNRIRISLAEV